MKLQLFDSHCHIDDPRFDKDREQVLANMEKMKVVGCVCVGADMPTSKSSMSMADAYKGIYASVGVHPHEAKLFKADDLKTLEEWSKNPKVVAIGEIGLDYYYDHSPRDIQMEAFLAQLDLAYVLDKPVIFHVREAHGPMLELLRRRKGSLPDGVMHCFSGSLESALEYIRLGFSIGIGGPVTFKNAPKVRRVIEHMPLDKLLIETDSPYLSPDPFRGKRNEPANVFYIAQKIAEIRNMPIEDIGEITTNNAKLLYRL